MFEYFGEVLYSSSRDSFVNKKEIILLSISPEPLSQKKKKAVDVENMISSQVFWTHRDEDRSFLPLFLSIFPLISIALLAHVISDIVLGRVWKTCQLDMANGKSWILYNSIS